MKERKIEIPLKKKVSLKDKSPKYRKEYYIKISNKIEPKTNREIIRKIDFFLNEKKSPSKLNLLDEKNFITKKSPKNKIKKRQNKFLKNKIKEKEPLSLNSNLNIYKIIHLKDVRNNKLIQQSSSINTDSMNSYLSNTSNKNININNKCISLLNKNDNLDNFKRDRIDSDISSISRTANKNQFYINKQNSERLDKKKKFNNYSKKKKKNNKKNKSKIKKKDSNKNIRINKLSPKSIRNINILNNPVGHDNKNNNLSDLLNNENKFNIKINDSYNKMREYKSEFKNNFNKNNSKKNFTKDYNSSNISNNHINDKTNNLNKYIEEKKNFCNTRLYSDSSENNKYLRTNNDDINYFKINEKIKIEYNFNNMNEKSTLINFNRNNNDFNNHIKDEKDLIIRKNLNPVKKSLFTEHMNFLNNQNENNINNNNNYEIYNDNYINFPSNNLLDSTDKKDYDSKFINYDLGKTNGTFLSKDSFLIYANKNNLSKSKINNLIDFSKNKFNMNNIEEKERTQEEMERLANEYLNMSKFWEYTDNNYSQNIIPSNTITTIIDNNNYNDNDDTILPDKNKKI